MLNIDSHIKGHLIGAEALGPIMLEAVEHVKPVDWSVANKELIHTLLLQYGGVIFRNFNIHSITEFKQFCQNISSQLLDYVNRSTPRTVLGDKIYTATEYPADRFIPLHNENSYTRSWPKKIMFFCVIPSETGGETPIADSRIVLKNIDTSIVNKFNTKEVLYVRNFHKGIDLSWQEVFQTSDKLQVEQYCRENAIDYAWLEEGAEFRTKQICQATLQHSQTKELVWFNQAHLFHITSQPLEIQASFLREFGQDHLPRNTFYGDGTEIEREVLEHIREAYDKATIKFSWQRGDIMLLDNILMAHGRTPFTGERKIVVAMSDPN